ncbi:DUF5309 family protein [Ruegeria sp. HKCCE4148]|uniref:SU10 major capsid protein n=1 Tax=Ruegeria sp. HKCCE4148 TaxID=2794829 RepID=UPI001AE20A09|nr:DUF5309 family protein [Ruegeria sp. HKCCE4148]
MATADYWSSADLKGVDHNGLIHEDVLNEIFDISRIPLPLSDMIGSDNVDNAYTEWTEDKLAQPDTSNANVDGQDASGNDAAGGARIGNHCQILDKVLQVTQRAQSSDTIGRADELAYQIMMRNREIRRDLEAISLTNQGSQADDGDAVPGLLGALGAYITQGDVPVDATGGGFANGVVTAYTPGTKRALTETMVRDVAQQVWEQGGDPSCLMSVPSVVRNLSSYMFTASARIATLTAETNQESPAKAVGSVNVFLTDFGVELKMVPNRLQQPHDSLGGTTGDAANVYIIDPAYLRHGYLEGFHVEPLAKVGLADQRQISGDVTLKVLNRDAHGKIGDIDIAAAVTA